MKRRDLIKKFEKNGWYFERAGGNHDIYTDGNRSESFGRHTEIDERLAQKMLKRNNIK